MAVKRFQRSGVVQPESNVEQAGHQLLPGDLPPRLQTAGKLAQAPPPTLGKKTIGEGTLATNPLFTTLVDIQTPPLQTRPNVDLMVDDATATGNSQAGGAAVRRGSTASRESQPAMAHPWGGRSIVVSPVRNDAITTVSEQDTKVETPGMFSVFPNNPLKMIISTVVRAPVGVAIHRFGGMVISPLYWLDTEPEFEEPPAGRNKWGYAAETGSKWNAQQHSAPRFTLSVEGGLEWPLFQS